MIDAQGRRNKRLSGALIQSKGDSRKYKKRDSFQSSQLVAESSDNTDEVNGEAKTFCGIRMKNKFGFLQFITLPLMSSVMITIGVYMNMQITQMLQDNQTFDIDEAEIG